MVVLTLIESHMWHLLVSTFRSKKMSHLTTRPGYIPVQVGLQYVSLIALMPEPLRCTKNDLVRQFCLHTQNHSWLTTHKSKACASPMWPHDTQQLATCDKLNRVSAHRSQKRRCATVGRVQQRSTTTVDAPWQSSYERLKTRLSVPTRDSIIQCCTVGGVNAIPGAAPARRAEIQKTFITSI